MRAAADTRHGQDASGASCRRGEDLTSYHLHSWIRMGWHKYTAAPPRPLASYAEPGNDHATECARLMGGHMLRTLADLTAASPPRGGLYAAVGGGGGIAMRAAMGRVARYHLLTIFG